MDKENNNNCGVNFFICFLKVTQGILYYSSHSETKTLDMFNALI